jgi:hypothetical protein
MPNRLQIYKISNNLYCVLCVQSTTNLLLPPPPDLIPAAAAAAVEDATDTNFKQDRKLAQGFGSTFYLCMDTGHGDGTDNRSYEA